MSSPFLGNAAERRWAFPAKLRSLPTSPGQEIELVIIGTSDSPEVSAVPATEGSPEASSVEPDGPVLVALTTPAEGVPEVIVNERDLLRAAQAIAAGTGPVAIDAERASGYRYGQKAYLVQLRREGAGTWLIDPIACPDLSPIGEVISDVEWILHAANQDLPCLAEIGMRPTRLFDTELGGRLVGLPRVGLAAVVEHYLGLTLAKEHSAVDWSTRPLPQPWLRYAALDVEVLIQVRDLMAADLIAQDKMQWAQEEFDALTRFTGPPARLEPWRRTSGLHKVRNRRGAAMVRELWQTRNAIALENDTAPGRVLPDAALVDLAMRAPKTEADINENSQPSQGGPPSQNGRKPVGRASRLVRRYQHEWLGALQRARQLPEADLPALTVRSEGPPPARAWADRDPVAAARLAQARAALGEVARSRHIPVENLLSPDLLRRVLWSPPRKATPASVSDALLNLGARRWQVDIAASILEEAINRPVAPKVEPEAEPEVEPTTGVSGEVTRG
ncbi:MAG: ribonuclease [Actinomycetota bacterium]|nr:ribonuclease [Actinomycetota bacterium]